jgi:23S rRNA pseudouridine955/2504/2580 synthase/23S rRNA pseudouridine1911/1915/1917 synthase
MTSSADSKTRQPAGLGIPDILYEDEIFLAVNKQPGMLVIPDRFREDIPNLRTLLAERYGEIWVVHRLDKDTSGIVLFAKTAEAHKSLNEEFSTHTVHKTYGALLRGRLEHASGAIQQPLAPHPKKKGLMQVHPAGKFSETHYMVRTAFRDFTFVDVTPVTGRQHQIRVHFAAIGHPLAIDPLYGSDEPILLSTIKKTFQSAGSDELPLIARLTLHAAAIEFTHPSTRVSFKIEAPLPKDLKAVLHQLEKWNSSAQPIDT